MSSGAELKNPADIVKKAPLYITDIYFYIYLYVFVCGHNHLDH